MLLVRSKLLLTIHNLNTWFFSTNFSSIKAIVKYIVRKLWLKKASALIVNDYVPASCCTLNRLFLLGFLFVSKNRNQPK
jgi:hypothetical protein